MDTTTTTTTTTTATPLPVAGTIAFTPDGRMLWDVQPSLRAQAEGYQLAKDEFLIRSLNGYYTIGRFTGTTRRIWKMACPKVERCEIETYADDRGVIRGRADWSDRTDALFIRPDYRQEA